MTGPLSRVGTSVPSRHGPTPPGPTPPPSGMGQSTTCPLTVESLGVGPTRGSPAKGSSSPLGGWNGLFGPLTSLEPLTEWSGGVTFGPTRGGGPTPLT